MAQNRRTAFLWFTGGVFIVALLINLGFLGFIPDTFVSLTGKVIRPAGNFVRNTKDSITTFYSFSSQLREVESLRRELATVRSENVRLEAVGEENQRLKQLLQLADSNNYKTIAAEIVTRDSTGVVQGATLNRGSEQGIKKGSAAIDQHGNLIGIVEVAYNNSSQIFFITDAQAKVDAIVNGRDASGLAQGSHGVGMELGLLSQEAIIERNDAVVTAGISGIIPPGIPIGAVDQILSSDTELFKRVTLIPYADIGSLRHVLVVLNP